MPLVIRFFFSLLVMGRVGEAAAQLPAASSPSSAAAEEPIDPKQYRYLCNRIWVFSEEDLNLNQVEQRLVCGDPTDDPVGQPWSEIPHNQARVFLNTFLQKRGFHQPQYVQQEDQLYLRVGPRARAESFSILGAPGYPLLQNRRDIKGRVLTPDLLNEFEKWGEYQLNVAGYPCREVRSEAFAETGHIDLYLEPGERKRILDVVDTVETDLYPDVLDRYHAFKEGRWYNEDLITLTERRIVEDGLAQLVSFSSLCTPEGVIVRRTPLFGPSRLVRLGIGGSTDEGLIIQALGRILRLGPTASSVTLSGRVSFLLRDIELRGRWYYHSDFERYYISPQVRYTEEDVGPYVATTTVGRLFHTFNWEFPDASLTWALGPAIRRTILEEGPGPEVSNLITAEFTLQWVSHQFELWQTSPRGGSQVLADFIQTQENFGAPFSATKIDFQGQRLWNYKNYDPPLLVLGVRGTVGSTFTATTVRDVDLPILFKFFTGGAHELRGFDRNSLPRSGLGALTEATLGFEGRYHRLLFRRVDPYAFFDLGILGERELTFEKPLYLSPGLGLRWESPIGVFRGYVARGMTAFRPTPYPYDPEGWRLFASFGEEF